uniref:Uncharacterized protein n=1 Tax=Cyclopterus lumpus TaxID=8103 RepID=A0A8C2WV67_CYCLU
MFFLCDIVIVSNCQILGSYELWGVRISVLHFLRAETVYKYQNINVYFSVLQFSPNGFPMILDSPLPQTPANQPPNSPVPPAETPSGAAPSAGAPQQVQQQKVINKNNIFYFNMWESNYIRLIFFHRIPTLYTCSTVQPVSQSAALVNPEQQSVVPTLGASLAGTQPTQGPASSGPQPNTSGVPSGLERHAQEAATVKAPIQEKLVF